VRQLEIPPPAQAAHPGPVLVGRTPEQQIIDTLVAGARLGRSGVLVLTGEAGIGKTALLEYAAATATPPTSTADVRMLRATGSEAEREVPFGGLAQLLRPSEADLDRIPAPQAQALGVALALRSGPDVDRLAIGAAVLSLLTRYSEDRAVGVIVDDAHLLDRPSSEALAFACRRLLADPVFVVIAARTEPRCVLTEAGLPQLVVGGLSEASTGTLVRSHGRHPTPSTVAELHRVTGGNPLAVLELARNPGRLLAAAPGSSTPVPIALITWFSQRAAALGDAARTALLVVAIAGGDRAVVARACAALGIDVQVLGAAERARLIEIGSGRRLGSGDRLPGRAAVPARRGRRRASRRRRRPARLAPQRGDARARRRARGGDGGGRPAGPGAGRPCGLRHGVRACGPADQR